MKVLLLGGPGMIGHRMWAEIGIKHDLYAVNRSDKDDLLKKLPGLNLARSTKIDLLDSDKLISIFEEICPDVVLNCAGIVKQLPISKNHSVTIETNALFPHKLAAICSQFNSRLILFSTDCVFDGTKGHYIETDETSATDLYGRTKILGEIDYLPNVLTIRTSTIGREVVPHGGLIEWFLSQQGKKIKGFSRAIYSGLPTKRLAEIIESEIFPREDLKGILHISSEPIDKYSLLLKARELFNLDVEIEKDDSFILDRSLNSNKFRELTNFKIPCWEELGLDLMCDKEIYDSFRNN